MAKPYRRSRAQHPTVLFSLLLAGIFVACTIGKSALPAFNPAHEGLTAGVTQPVTRAFKAELRPSLASGLEDGFTRMWNAEVLDDDRANVEPAVYFAWADIGSGAEVPFDVLASVGNNRAGFAPASPDQAQCLATVLYFEARGESRLGPLAVAQVVLNRTENRSFPKTICGVVYQDADKLHRCQFSFACDGIPDRIVDRAAWRQAQAMARTIIADPDQVVLADVGNATHYHATYVTPAWAHYMRRVDMIGHHVFYASYAPGTG